MAILQARLSIILVLMANNCRSESLPYSFRNPIQSEALFAPPSAGMYEYGAHSISFPDGNEAIFYCANINPYEIRDHILFRTRPNNHSAFSSPPQVALAPYNEDINNSVAWDAVHVCDPRVVRGDFESTDGVFEFAMFYTGTDCYSQDYPHPGCVGSSHNQIGVVFARNESCVLRGDWKRLTSTPMIASKGTYSEWGVGQPSATSVDGESTLLLFYTVSYLNNHIVANELDLRSIAQPVVVETLGVVTDGLQDIGTADPIIFNNAKFAFVDGLDMFVMMREQHPYPDDFISQQIQIAVTNQSTIWQQKGSWYQVGEIAPILTGWDRSHNAGFATSEYGHIQGDRLRLLYSTATAMADFDQELWTYLLHELDVQFCIDEKHCDTFR